MADAVPGKDHGNAALEEHFSPPDADGSAEPGGGDAERWQRHARERGESNRGNAERSAAAGIANGPGARVLREAANTVEFGDRFEVVRLERVAVKAGDQPPLGARH